MDSVTRPGRTTDLHLKKWKDASVSPERNRVWTEPPHKHRPERKVPVVYYLSRNGQLEHPHFVEVTLSSSDGLYLRDVIERLNSLRGNAMAASYAWSSKRNYKNGFVWQDLAENDFIYPAHGQEYVLKGSELANNVATISKSNETGSSPSNKSLQETESMADHADVRAIRPRRRNQSWSEIDMHEYRVYKAECSGESLGRFAADASTQTEDKRPRGRSAVIREEEENENENENENEIVELSRGDEIEISPPPSDSSTETLETLMKSDGRLVRRPESEELENPTAKNQKSKSSSVLMHLLYCGSMSFRDCGPGKDHPGVSLISQYKSRLPRGEGSSQVEKGSEEATNVEAKSYKNKGFGGRMMMSRRKQVVLEDKEYFSGSLIETKKEEFHPVLKRSSSYNADRSLGMEVMEKRQGECNIPREVMKTQQTTTSSCTKIDGKS